MFFPYTLLYIQSADCVQMFTTWYYFSDKYFKLKTYFLSFVWERRWFLIDEIRRLKVVRGFFITTRQPVDDDYFHASYRDVQFLHSIAFRKPRCCGVDKGRQIIRYELSLRYEYKATDRWMNGGLARYLKDVNIFDRGEDKNEWIISCNLE